MAKTEQEIRGKVGNMVFYKVGNEIRVRSFKMPIRKDNIPEDPG